MVDLYDSDLLVIEQVQNALNLRVGMHLDVDGYAREIKERFGEAGFLVDVAIMQVTGPGPLPMGTYVPQITILSRVTPEQFDREKMTWEVQHDILEIEETPGAMQRDGTIKSPAQLTSFPKK